MLLIRSVTWTSRVDSEVLHNPDLAESFNICTSSMILSVSILWIFSIQELGRSKQAGKGIFQIMSNYVEEFILGCIEFF